ncbi:PEP-CTERM sorting domain-containing protein [Desulfococcus sp.]|uniref:PEP-CTERM sorting domain-containing protein n=1 Tax=Desulfococcus sp. TaxID=2025834 RepID=UPI0035936CA4
MKRLSGLIMLCISISICVNPVYGDSLSLSDFVGEPSHLAYSIGNTITLEEDTSGNLGYIYFLNNNYYVTGDAITLSFVYEFTLQPGDSDYLVAKIGNTYVTEILGDNSFGSDELILPGSGSIDLTPYQGSTISLAFGLEIDWADLSYTSVASLSNLEITTSSIQPVPEPATFLSLGLGLAGLAGFRRRYSRKKITSRASLP